MCGFKQYFSLSAQILIATQGNFYSLHPSALGSKYILPCISWVLNEYHQDSSDTYIDYNVGLILKKCTIFTLTHFNCFFSLNFCKNNLENLIHSFHHFIVAFSAAVSFKS